MTPALDRRTLILSLAGLAGLAGCDAIGGGPALDAFELRAPTAPPTGRRSLARDVVVELPEARAALDTDRIMIRPNPLQTQYLPGVRWTGSAPAMVQTLMLRTLQDANAFRYVGRRPVGPGADFALVSELTDFQAELREGSPGPLIRMRLILRIVREQDASILASRSFQASAEAASLETLTVVSTFNTVTDALLDELSRWVLARLGA